MAISSDQVASFLREHPHFFEEYAPLIADIQLPHPHGGRTISISERQILTLREKNKLLEGKLAELIEFGEENDAIGEKVHRFCLALIECDGLDQLVDAVYSNLEDEFDVPHVAMRLWGRAPDRDDRTEFARVPEEVQKLVASMAAPVCGPHAVYELAAWFADAASLKSFALVPLKHSELRGLLVLASEDAKRFYPEMGTIFLKRIGELVSASVAARLP